MSRFKLGTEFVYTCRNTPACTVYRSRRNVHFVIVVRTLSQMECA